MMKNYAIFRHIFYIATFLLLLCATGCIQSQAQTRRYAATQRKTATKKRGVTPQQKKTSGNRTTNNPKTPIKKNDVLYINYGETKNYIGRINYDDYSMGVLYGKEPITGSYKNSVIRNNKSMVIEYNINIDWPRDLNYRDYGAYYEKNLKFLKEVQDLIKMKLVTVGIIDDLTQGNILEIDHLPNIESCLKLRVGYLKDCQQVLKNTITISTSLMETHAIVTVQEKNVDVDGNTTIINQSAKLSPDGRIFSPLSETPDSKPDGYKEYICNFGSKSMILGLPDTSDKSNTKRPYYQYVTYLNKETPHTLEIKEDENEFVLVLEEYSYTDELISKFILQPVVGDSYEGEYYNFIANEKWNIWFASREY